MTPQKAQFRDCVKAFSREINSCEISELTDIQKSDTLTLAYIAKVFNVVNPGLFPEDIDELRQNIVDGPRDRGADFIFKADNQVYIIQAKYHSADVGEKEADFEFFRSVIRRLCPETGEMHKKNQKIYDLISDVDWDTDSFHLIYLSLTKTNPAIEITSSNGVDNVPNTALADINDRCAIDYLSEVELNKAYREIVAGGSGETKQIDVFLAPLTSDDEQRYLVVDQGDGRRCFLAALSAGQVHQLFLRNKGGALFNLNIRNYVGDTKTNRDIMDTVRDEPKNFFYYNNGLSAIARHIEVKADTNGNTILQCTGFSIINGAQTFRSISKAHGRLPKGTTERLLVPIRITEYDYAKNVNDVFLEKITRFNNTQNSVKISDFRSNDPVQTSIAKYVSGVMARDGKKYFYKNKRSHGVDRGRIPIGLDEYCRTVHAFLFGPADIFGGSSYLYDTAKGYQKLFGDFKVALSDETLDQYFSVWLICDHANEKLKEDRAERELAMENETDEEAKERLVVRKNALERRFHVYYAMAQVVREYCRLKQKGFDELISSFSKPKWLSDQKKIRQVDAVFDIACDVIVNAYQFAIRGGSTHRNFFRDEQLPNLIKDALSSRLSQLKGLDF